MNDQEPIPEEHATFTLDQLIDEFVQTPEDRHRFLRTGWISDIIGQLIDARFEAGLTQKELGERMGKQQSAIARLESNNDIKLSTLFDYLAALGLTPAGEIPVEPYAEVFHSQFPRTADETAGIANAGENEPATVLAAD